MGGRDYEAKIAPLSKKLGNIVALFVFYKGGKNKPLISDMGVWRMKKRNGMLHRLCVFTVIMVINMLAIHASANSPPVVNNEFNPQLINGLEVWLDATSIDGQNNATLTDEDSVGTWTDLSGNGNDATQTTAAYQPTFTTESRVTPSHSPTYYDYPAVRFFNEYSYYGGYFQFASLGMPMPISDDFTIIIVTHQQHPGAGGAAPGLGIIGDGDTGAFMIGHGNNSLHSSFFGITSSSGGWDYRSILLMRRDQSEGTMEFTINDPSPIATIDAGNDSVTGTTLGLGGAATNHNGSAAQWPMWGYIHEVIIYNSVVSDEDLSSLYYYLSQKWLLEDSIDSDSDDSVDSEDSDNPVLLNEPTESISEGHGYSFIPYVTDPDGDTLTYSITNQPSWASFDTSTGVLTGTPNYTESGTYSDIEITVSDGVNDAVTVASSFDITVVDNQAPVVSYKFSPTDISGLSLWLDAANIDGSDNSTLSDADSISEWVDLSGSDQGLTQSNANYKPVLDSDGLNSLGVVQFDGSNDYLSRTTFSNWPTNDITVIIVQESVEGGGILGVEGIFSFTYSDLLGRFNVLGPLSNGYGTIVWDYGLTDSSTHTQDNAGWFGRVLAYNGIVDTYEYSNSDYHLLELGYDSTINEMSVGYNGIELVSTLTDNYYNSLDEGIVYIHDINNQTGFELSLGRDDEHRENNSHNYAQSNVAEVIIWSQALTDDERHIVNYYLSQKWGLESLIDSDGDGTVDESDSENPSQEGVITIPEASVDEGSTYSFIPYVTDSDGDTLTYSI